MTRCRDLAHLRAVALALALAAPASVASLDRF
jgi:hypothetical protein